ncbi:uncharacterized protein LOC119958365 isoform X2 [Scyliorhinus canicula]|uniref:uncharacterized protein LOC119958365 isoform X2 n=1 Tax=Scyliorhinus canicula TaxID=7830 RepID=UPI0018F5AEBF|nr:uncharacterized protein LOC119958365 isoform X2 [Scyliorhinus canicula]
MESHNMRRNFSAHCEPLKKYPFTSHFPALGPTPGLLLNFGRAQDRLPKPTISFEPVTGIALEGGIIIIKCAVNINDPKLIYIFRGQEMVFNSTQDSNETAVFTIGNVTSTNRGIYRCIYDLLVPIQRRSGLSNVIRLTVHRTKAPLSILHPADVEVNAGVTLNMSCSTARNGRCFYYQDSKFQLAEGRNNVTVSIKNISFCDEGNYTCYCLVEVNNSTVFSARSNIMQVAVSGKLTDRPEAKNKVTTEASDFNLTSAMILIVTAFIALILTSALLGVILPKKSKNCHVADTYPRRNRITRYFRLKGTWEVFTKAFYVQKNNGTSLDDGPLVSETCMQDTNFCKISSALLPMLLRDNKRWECQCRKHKDDTSLNTP